MALAGVLQLIGGLELLAPRFEQARGPLEEGLDIVRRLGLTGQDTRELEMGLLYWMGYAQWGTGHGDVRATLERALALARSVGDQRWVAMVLDHLAWLVHAEAGEFREARRKHAQSRAICQARGDEHGVARATVGLAHVYRAEGDLETAERMARQGLSTWRGLGHPYFVADALGILAQVLHCAGKYDEIPALVEEQTAILAEVGMPNTESLVSLGYTEMHRGQYERAREHLESVLQTTERQGETVEHAVVGAALGYLALRGGAYAEAKRLCRESITIAEKRGTSEAAIPWRFTLAQAELGLGELDDARKHVAYAFRWLRERGSFPTLVDALPIAAFVLLKQGDVERAVEVYALGSTFGHVANSQWFEDVIGQPIAQAAGTLPAAAVAAAKERGSAREVQATLGELIAEWG
jgi:tetratricopeptide (TPR) repeat protein